MNLIRVLNMTKLFKKEMMLYAIADIHFNTPKRLSFGIYFIIMLIIWTIPMVMLFGLSTSPYILVVYFGVPFGASHFMSQPIWGGKTFFSWFKCMIQFMISPKNYYDGKAVNTIGKFVPHTYTLVSRTKDFQKLVKLELEERKLQGHSIEN